MSLSAPGEMERLCTLMDEWAPSTGDREGSAWRKNLWVGRLRACMSKSMSQSVAIDPAGFIPTKVNTVHLPEDEPVPPLPREQWDDSDPLLHSSFSYGSSAQQRDPNAGLSVYKFINQKVTNQGQKTSAAKARGEKLRVSMTNSLSKKINKKGVRGEADRSSLDKKIQKTKTRRARRTRTHREPEATLAPYCCWAGLRRRQEESLSAGLVMSE